MTQLTTPLWLIWGPFSTIFCYFLEDLPDVRGSVWAQNVKLTDPLVDLSEFLRVKSVYFLSREVCGSPGAVFRNLHFTTFVGVRAPTGSGGDVPDVRGSVWARNVKLTDPLVDLSELLRVKSVDFLSRDVCGSSGAVFRNLHFTTFV